MSTTITCTNCGEVIEITSALQEQIKGQVLKDFEQRHALELEKVKIEAGAQAQKKAAQEQQERLKALQEDALSEKEKNKELREQQIELRNLLRQEQKAKENAELEAQKRLMAEENKIREEVTKSADEKYRLKIAEQEKKLADTQRALEEAQRKASQGSQQLQGEILELDLEESLRVSFKDDEIEPIAKGVRGGDIRQTVKSPRGIVCGVLLWEIKRTKNWVDGWITKLKEDARNEKANIPIIVTEVMPKHIGEDMGVFNGVWICKPQLMIILGTLLRKSLLDAGMQRALAENRGTKAEALFNFVTSHEFVQQIESMIET